MRYYWLKLEKNFFSDTKIKILEKTFENGRDHLLNYIKLLCETVNSAGTLEFCGTQPGIALAAILDISKEKAEEFLEALTSVGLAKLEDSALILFQVEQMTGAQPDWAAKKAAYRAKKKAEEEKKSEEVKQKVEEVTPAKSEEKTKEAAEPKKKSKETETINFPENLNTPEFKMAWSNWVQFRKEIKKKLIPSTVKSSLRKLEKYPVETAILAIEESICNQWQGLFPERIKTSKYQAPKTNMNYSNKGDSL